MQSRIDPEESGYRSPFPKWTVVLALGAGLLAAKFAVPAATEYLSASSHSRDFRQEVESAVRENSPESRFFSSLRQYYPAEYERFLEVTEAASKQGDDALRQAAFDFSRELILSKRDAMATAPDNAIRAIMTADLALMEELQSTDIPLCAQYVMRGFSSDTRLASPELVRLIGDLTISRLQAAHASESGNQVTRSAPTDVQADAWLVAIGRIDRNALRLLTYPEELFAAPPQQQCSAGLHAVEAALSLDESTSASIGALLIREAPAS